MSGFLRVIIACILSAFLYRMSIIPSHLLGIWDILCVVGTRLLYEAKEWAIHPAWFHGGANFRAYPLFKSHDRHHDDLPYYHVAVVGSLKLLAVSLVVSMRHCAIGFKSPLPWIISFYGSKDVSYLL